MRRLRNFLVAAVALALAAIPSCSPFRASDEPTGDGGSADGTPDAVVEASTDAAPADAPPPPLNPYGVLYPTAHIGRTVRLGLTPGDVLANLKFTGYAPGLTVPSFVQMATFFDPQGRTHDLVAVLLLAVWESNSTKLMTALASALPARVVVIAVLGESDTPTTPATLADLTAWRTKLPAAWNVLDPSWSQFDAPPALPRVIEIDARTMEIVKRFEGFDPNLKAQLETDAAEVLKRPPSY